MTEEQNNFSGAKEVKRTVLEPQDADVERAKMALTDKFRSARNAPGASIQIDHILTQMPRRKHNS